MLLILLPCGICRISQKKGEAKNKRRVVVRG